MLSEKENEELIEIKRVASEFINKKLEQFSIGEFRNKLTELEKTINLNNEEEIALNNRIIDLETKIEKKDKIIYEIARSNVELKGYEIKDEYINNTVSFFTKYTKNLERNPHWRKEKYK